MPPIPLDPEKQTFLPCPSLPHDDHKEEPQSIPNNPSNHLYNCAFDGLHPSDPRNSVQIAIRREKRIHLGRRIIFFSLLFAGMFYFFNLGGYIPSCSMHIPERHVLQAGQMKTKRIPLEAHIMSKCPDARDCLRDLIVPAMEEVEGKVDLRVSFIGRIEPDDGVSCKHGPTECLGNLLELCAAKLYPRPKQFLGFTLCLSLSYDEIPKREFIESCALESGIDVTKLEACTSGQEEDQDSHGRKDDDDDGHIAWGLLKKSIERSEKANVTTSCTVRLDEEVRCVRDGGEWKDCEGGSGVGDLVRDVERLFRGRNAGEEGGV